MSYKIVEQMSLEQENFLPDVFYPDNDGDLIFLPIHQRNTSKTKKKEKKKENTIHLSREAYVKRFDMRRRNTLSFISHISMLPVGTNLQRIIEANNVRTRRSNKFYAHSWRLKIRNRPKHFSSHSLRCLVFQLTRRIMLESMTPSLSGSWLSSIRVFPL